MTVQPDTETIPAEEPWDRTSGPVHAQFGLTYANFLIWHRAHMQSMPLEWQRRFVDLSEEFSAAYPVAGSLCYEVATVRDAYVNELTDDEMRQLGVERGDDGEGFYRSGCELNEHEHIGVPVPDPVPHYRHAYLPPDEAAIAAVKAQRES
ncbi:MAG TPA: hypothetical protein VGG54_22940 [Trebonia sp.]|jgi:hypothetical protein